MPLFDELKSQNARKNEQNEPKKKAAAAEVEKNERKKTHTQLTNVSARAHEKKSPAT